MLAQRSTPIKLSQEAAVKLPRFEFWLLLALFALSGFFATDLWTPRDIDSFGDAWLLAQKPFVEWLMPTSGEEVLTRTGPLVAWFNAFLMLVFGPKGLGLLTEIGALRFSAMIFFTVTTFSIWESTYRLARRPEAQPIAFAFGGEARPKDFARSIADSAVLRFVAIFGILTRQHEAVSDTALLAVVAANLYCLTIAIKRPFLGSVLAGLTVGVSVLASTLFAGVWLLAQSFIVLATLSHNSRERDTSIILLVITAWVTFGLWPLLAWLSNPGVASSWFSHWAITQTDYFGPAGLSTYAWFAKHTLWFLLPIWPLVLTGFLRWGRRLISPFLLLPAVVIAVTLLGVVFSSRQSTDSVFLACIPAMVVFAAFSLLTVKQGWENILDWFGLTIFSLGGLTIWLYWIAWLTGIPPKMHQSIMHLAPGAQPSFGLGFFMAIAVSIIWIAMLVWRLTHRSVALWRGPWINAVGMTMAVTVAFGLFSGATTEFRSFRPAAQKIDELLVKSGWQAGDCISPRRISAELGAVLQYYGGEPLDSLHQTKACKWTLVRSSSTLATTSGYTPEAVRTRSGEYFYVFETNALDSETPFSKP